MITSSVSSFWKALERNRAPRIGMSPMPGMVPMLVPKVLRMRPPMAKLWPLASSTTVSAERVVRPGMFTPFMSMPLAGVISLTSGRTWMLMRLFDSTVGWNSRLAPKRRNCTEVWPKPCATGIGISPPARKLAFSPEMAVRFGSARIVTSPASARASRVADTLLMPSE